LGSEGKELLLLALELAELLGRIELDVGVADDCEEDEDVEIEADEDDDEDKDEEAEAEAETPTGLVGGGERSTGGGGFAGAGTGTGAGPEAGPAAGPGDTFDREGPLPAGTPDPSFWLIDVTTLSSTFCISGSFNTSFMFLFSKTFNVEESAFAEAVATCETASVERTINKSVRNFDSSFFRFIIV
jgi:hypothetical protein